MTAEIKAMAMPMSGLERENEFIIADILRLQHIGDQLEAGRQSVLSVAMPSFFLQHGGIERDNFSLDDLAVGNTAARVKPDDLFVLIE